MVDHLAVLLALRQRLLTLSVVGTGPTALAATGTGYTRSAGSFVADGFLAGMEVVPAGFADTTPSVVRRVSALTLEVDQPRTAEAEAAGRTLGVGLPLLRAWENVVFSPADGRWYLEEDYLPGPAARATLGSKGELQAEPTYVLRLYGLAGTGVGALYRVADAVLRLFAPGASFSTSDEHLLRVRSDPAPFRGQVLPEESSHAVVTITVPLWVRTAIPTTP